MRNFCNGIGDLNTPYCDAEHGRKGRVKRKDVHHGYPLADTEVRAENQRGELTVTNGLATVMLPSKDIDTRYFKDAAGFELGLPTVRQVTIAFGDTPLADRAHEINVFCAGGEDYLMPDGLTPEKHPLRPPVKVYGHFAGFMGGTSALCATLAAPLAQQMLSTVDLPGIGAAQILTAPFRYPQLLLRVTRAAAAMGVDRTIKNINKNIYLWSVVSGRYSNIFNWLAATD
jgi:hypothetical protein